MTRSELLKEIQAIKPQTFDQISLKVFQYQYEKNTIYRKFVQLLGKSAHKIKTIEEIPFLPISLFKTHKIQSATWQAEAIFSSSGTTSTQQSQHHVRDLNFYLTQSKNNFERHYGALENFHILALLPSYLERKDSSLIHMMNHFIKATKSTDSGFYLNNTAALARKIAFLKHQKKNVLLFGVTYALLDFAETYASPLPDQFIIMETGGMKGRRKELLKTAVHTLLKTAFQQNQIHSEYGMTELLSQAYAMKNERFVAAPSMRVFCRESTDPLTLLPYKRTGGLNIIDLANIDSCSFIATDDLAKIYEDGSFEVLGRFDASDIRGCNLMVEF